MASGACLTYLKMSITVTCSRGLSPHSVSSLYESTRNRTPNRIFTFTGAGKNLFCNFSIAELEGSVLRELLQKKEVFFVDLIVC